MELGSSSSTRRGRVLIALAALALVLAIPAVASAKVTVPPGSTEGDQYFEEVPNGGGSSSVDRDGGAGGGAPVAATPELNKLGAEGKAAADLANSNRPQPLKLAEPAADPNGSSTEGEGGMGLFFPLLLVGAVLAAIVFVLGRRLNPA